MTAQVIETLNHLTSTEKLDRLRDEVKASTINNRKGIVVSLFNQLKREYPEQAQNTRNEVGLLKKIYYEN